ncbi:transporter, major facilitator family protein [Aedoeadaptatus nemausensis]|uniref:Transporter, major facilitator family protein n=1 Tax=Aedoeadaptatus nemausensis TaxID=2582829 RepID=A0A6V6Y789_9FIRM|nr:peptide MFS transporter [Peptoniphilus nemausensis]CAC9935955.1 transporter, major facilitator family protein [Peptoniphilus nemausensis]
MNTKTKMPFGFYVVSIGFSLERFAFYSAKWLMTVMVAAAIVNGGLGMTDADAAKMSANLVAWTYVAPVAGSIISDRFIGARYLIPVGMVLMGAGYLIGWQATTPAMINIMIAVVSIGTGLFKPQSNAITGRLFDDPKVLDSAYSLQYSFVNIGSFIGTTIIGILAISKGYSFCFLVCGIIMFINAIWFIFGWRYLGDAGKKPFKVDERKALDEEAEAKEEKRPLTDTELKRVGAIVLVSAFSTIFWLFWYLAYMPVYFHWAGDNPAANWMIGGFEVPTAWFDSLNALCCITMGPLLGAFWAKRARSPKGDFNMFQKTSFGMLLLGLAYIIFAVADIARGNNLANLGWIVAFGITLSLGEMVFSPLGNSFISKFAPARLLSVMMSVWTLAVFASAKTYGYLYEFTLKFPFAKTYFVIAAIAIVCGLILFAVSPKLNNLVVEHED